MPTIGMDAYGLRLAKKLAIQVRAEVKGENGVYAKGFRDAIRHIIQDIDAHLDEIKETNLLQAVEHEGSK